MWEHDLISYLERINVKYITEYICPRIHTAEKFNIGEIEELKKVHKTAKNIYDKNDAFFQHLPYENCFVEYKADGWRKSFLLKIVKKGQEETTWCPETIETPNHVIYKIPEKLLIIYIFSSAPNEKKWSMYPYFIGSFGTGVCIINEMPDLVKMQPSELDWELCAKATAQTDMMYAYYFIMLLNCKNITIEEISPPEKVNKKRIKNCKLPLYSYHVLNVKPFGSYRPVRIGRPEAESHNRLHFCRGHFKQFFPDRPLFGKISGLFWWEPTLRGKNRDGFVDKDYKVTNTPPERPVPKEEENELETKYRRP